MHESAQTAARNILRGAVPDGVQTVLVEVLLIADKVLAAVGAQQIPIWLAGLAAGAGHLQSHCQVSAGIAVPDGSCCLVGAAAQQSALSIGRVEEGELIVGEADVSFMSDDQA